MSSTSFARLFTVTAMLQELGRRLARVRLERAWSQQMLADKSGVSLSSIARLEAGQSVTLQNFLQIVDALGLRENLDQLLPPDEPGPMALLAGAGAKRRQRAPRGASEGEEQTKSAGWTWGDEA